MYICLQRSKEVFNVYGNSLGQSGDSALYYSTEIGRRRIYRQTYPIPMYKKLRLLTYKNKKNAQKVCDYINKLFNDNYEVVEI